MVNITDLTAQSLEVIEAKLICERLVDTIQYTVHQLYEKKNGELFILVTENEGDADDYIVPEDDYEWDYYYKPLIQSDKA